MSTPRLLFIIPAFNEEQALPKVLATLATQHPDADIVVVDDGSLDATAEAARTGGAVVLGLPFNLGIGAALRTGFVYAVRQGYDRAVQFDGDGQHEADAVRSLLDALDQGANMAIGSRFADPGSTYDPGRVRGKAMGALRFLVRRLTGTRYSDTSSGFRAFDRPMLEFFARTYPSEYMESVEALVMASVEGFRVVEVPVEMHEREAGEPSNASFKLAYHFLRLLVVLTATAFGRRRPAPAVITAPSVQPEGTFPADALSAPAPSPDAPEASP
jgi:glycosyltransferase involved in cell wall biosynthesis